MKLSFLAGLVAAPLALVACHNPDERASAPTAQFVPGATQVVLAVRGMT